MSMKCTGELIYCQARTTIQHHSCAVTITLACSFTKETSSYRSQNNLCKFEDKNFFSSISPHHHHDHDDHNEAKRCHRRPALLTCSFDCFSLQSPTNALYNKNTKIKYKHICSELHTILSSQYITQCNEYNA